MTLTQDIILNSGIAYMEETLDRLKPGDKGAVTGFSEEGPVMQRLMQLGVLEGSELEIIRYAPGGDPIEIRVMGYCLSLRKKEAQLIQVERV